MRISFDIDDTLVLQGNQAAAERPLLPSFFGGCSGEPLRAGTRALVRELRRRGCDIWIYTSSLRGAFHIRLWLFLHGIHVNGIVNDDRHRQKLANRNFSRLPSKYPPAFGIDLHVDDSEGVKMEGDEHGFKVLVIDPNDENWTQKVLNAASVAATK